MFFKQPFGKRSSSMSGGRNSSGGIWTGQQQDAPHSAVFGSGSMGGSADFLSVTSTRSSAWLTGIHRKCLWGLCKDFFLATAY